jgi:hypothetical protein
MENWRDELPDDLKTSTNLAKYETLEAALRGSEEMSGRLGRSITIPSEDAGEDAWANYVEKLRKTAPNLILHPDHGDEDHAKDFWKMVGVPDEKTGYEPPADFEALPSDYVENMKSVAAAAGWTKKQFESTLNELGKEYTTQQQTMQEAKAAEDGIINGKFGLAKDQKLEGIKAFAEQFADPDHPPAWLSDPTMLSAGDILMMDKIVAGFTGKGPQAYQQPAGGDQKTPEEIVQQQTDIRTRLLDEQYTMPRTEYKRLTLKLVTLGRLLEATK